MSRNLSYKYRVITHIAEDDEWEEQELISGAEWDSMSEADAEARSVDLSKYPQGSFTYLESRAYSPWGPV